MVLWSCRRREVAARQNAAVLIRSAGATTGDALSEERALKMQLKLSWRTGTGWKRVLEMSDCLQQRIGVQAPGRVLLPAKPGPQSVHPSAQLLAQPVECLQGEGQAQFFRRCFEGPSG